MVSLVQLDTHCLIELLELLDVNSLHSIMLTCKRLYELAIDCKYWQNSVHSIRARYFLVELLLDGGRKEDVKDVVERAVQAITDVRMVSFKMYDKVFELTGPVVAKLFSMIREPRQVVERGRPRVGCSIYKNSFKLELGSGRKFYVNGSFFSDSLYLYNNVATVYLDVEEKKYCCEIHKGCLPEDALLHPERPEELQKRLGEEDDPFLYLSDFQDSFNHLKEPFEILQNEIGMTQPPLTPAFFYWFANQDWLSPGPLRCDDAQKILFKDPGLNTEKVWSHCVMKEYRESVLQMSADQMENWKMKLSDSEATSAVEESVGILIKRSAEIILKSLQFDVERIASLYSHMEQFKTKVVKIMIGSTIFDLKPNEWKGSITSEYVRDIIGLRCDSGIIEVNMWSYNDSYRRYKYNPEWESFCLNYKLPSGAEYSIDTIDYVYPSDILTTERILNVDWHLPCSSMVKLAPLTSVFQEKVNRKYGNSENVPQVTNAFVFVYLVAAMGFDSYGCDLDQFPEEDLKHLKKDCNMEKEEELSNGEG